mmetsp:Transcript_5134/g.12619  ORF Transcript_5134/g.12619 Transcript_5134/m.12619 type:complete len:314 (-) Transcript_5134:105-1046(-)
MACCTDDPVRLLCPAERRRAAASTSARNAFIRSASTGSPKRTSARRSQKRSHSRTKAVPARTELAPQVRRCLLRVSTRSASGNALGVWSSNAAGTAPMNSATARSMSSCSLASTSVRISSPAACAAEDAALEVSNGSIVGTTSAVQLFALVGAAALIVISGCAVAAAAWASTTGLTTAAMDTVWAPTTGHVVLIAESAWASTTELAAATEHAADVAGTAWASTTGHGPDGARGAPQSARAASSWNTHSRTSSVRSPKTFTSILAAASQDSTDDDGGILREVKMRRRPGEGACSPGCISSLLTDAGIKTRRGQV